MKIHPLFQTVDSSMNFGNSIITWRGEHIDGAIKLFRKKILGMTYIIFNGRNLNSG